MVEGRARGKGVGPTEPTLRELGRFHAPVLRGAVQWIARGVRVSVGAIEIVTFVAGLLIAINPVLFHWLGSPNPWLATPFFVATMVLELARSNYQYFKPIQDERDELGRQLEVLTGIRVEQRPRVRTAIVEGFPKSMRLSPDERFVLFNWVLAALDGNELDYEPRSLGDRYELRCYGQILLIEREHRSDLEQIAAKLRVVIDQLKSPELDP